jgi:bacterioferritin
MDQAVVLTDVQNLRKRARQHIEEGAVTSGYSADRETVLKQLNDALATELHSKGIADEFLAHSNEEQGHADALAERIAIDSYRAFVQYLGDRDPTTRRLVETILAVEEQHADELADLLQAVG